jgi:hypothetical protein
MCHEFCGSVSLDGASGRYLAGACRKIDWSCFDPGGHFVHAELHDNLVEQQQRTQNKVGLYHGILTSREGKFVLTVLPRVKS